MALRRWLARAAPLPGAPQLSALEVSREEWPQCASAAAAAGASLLALWGGAGARVHAAFLASDAVLVATLSLPPGEQRYPGIQDAFPSAARMQRAVFDLNALQSSDEDTRPWLRHAAWPGEFHPLADAVPPHAVTPGGEVQLPLQLPEQPRAERPAAPLIDDYAFVRVAGEGIHEIPVGPVHAGTIEPGHFRFSVVGEKVLKLEERLGYAHKGIERRFADLTLLEGRALAARICGDSTVAFSWAYAQALEGMTRYALPARAAWLRALALELERLANHLGDLGALGNDAGFAFGLSQFSRLKELLLRAIEAALGRRYLFDYVVPGGVARDVGERDALAGCVSAVARETAHLRDIYDNHAGVRDRFVAAGEVPPTLAARLGLHGLAGRASGQARDLRCDLPCSPYDELAPQKAVRREGDVAARVAVRFDEALESCRLIAALLERLPAGEHCGPPLVLPPAGAFAIGLVEGWRGPVLVALEAGEEGRVRRCHPHDPSWQNWPVLEHAIVDNIVPDFPLINKSFNLAYSGHDL